MKEIPPYRRRQKNASRPRPPVMRRRRVCVRRKIRVIPILLVIRGCCKVIYKTKINYPGWDSGAKDRPSVGWERRELGENVILMCARHANRVETDTRKQTRRRHSKQIKSSVVVFIFVFFYIGRQPKESSKKI